jgi:hypothetical protein
MPRNNSRGRSSGIPIAHREVTRGSREKYKLLHVIILFNMPFLCVDFYGFYMLITFLLNFFFLIFELKTNSSKFLSLQLAANFRSVSAVDANAVQRARARAQYANMSRQKMTPGSASVRK